MSAVGLKPQPYTCGAQNDAAIFAPRGGVAIVDGLRPNRPTVGALPAEGGEVFSWRERSGFEAIFIQGYLGLLLLEARQDIDPLRALLHAFSQKGKQDNGPESAYGEPMVCRSKPCDRVQ